MQNTIKVGSWGNRVTAIAVFNPGSVITGEINDSQCIAIDISETLQ